MMRRIEGNVESITSERPGAQELRVHVGKKDPPSAAENAAADSVLRPALNYTALTGRVAVGDRVLLNTVAIELGLGTGGQDFVVAVLDREPVAEPAPGHILKLRYTPLQTPVLAVEAQESPHHETMRRFESLNELPVVCAELHSQLPAICEAACWAMNECGFSRFPRIVYVMTDSSALPLALSRTVPELKERGLLHATVTAGQAFGGDYEAVNLYSALAAAKEVANADMVVVCQGPGNVGTGTPLGFSGIEQGMAINAADALGGVPIATVRVSFADQRERHRGISHHTLTILQRVARASALVPIPRLPESLQLVLQSALEETGIAEKHQLITVDAERCVQAMETSDIHLSTMGRGLNAERPFFLAAAAAGLLAAQLVEARSS